MATLLSNTVWEGLSTEPRPTPAQGAADGQFYKELDTGESYIRVNGNWTFINLGLSFIKATKSGQVTTDAHGLCHVSFNTPFINAQYRVSLTIEDTQTTVRKFAYSSNIQLDGFDITTVSPNVAVHTYMLANAASDIATYYKAISLPAYTPGSQGAIATTGVGVAGKLLATFITEPAFPGVAAIPAGIFRAEYRTAKAAGANNYYTYFEIWKRTAAGAESLLCTSNRSTEAASNTIQSVNLGAILGVATALAYTDRLVLKVYGVLLSSTATLTLYFDGTTGAHLSLPEGGYNIGNVTLSYLATRDYNP